MSNKESMGEIFRRLRTEKGFTQRGLALKMGVSHSTISKIENNERRPKFEILESYSKALNADLSYLLSIAKDAHINEVSMRPLRQEIKVSDRPRSSSRKRTKVDMSMKIPLLGSIRAGEQMLAEQNIEGYLTIDRNTVHADKTYYALKVKGDSMDRLFPENTTLIVEKTDMVESGQIAVIGINGYEATVKRVSFAEDNIALIPQSNNPAYETKVYNIEKDEIHIMGRVIQAIRFF